MNLAGLMKYVRAHRSGVVASVHSDGGPEAAYLEIAVTDGGELVFDTPPTSRKAMNIERDPRVALVLGGADGTTLQCEGSADRPDGADWDRCRAAYVTAFPEYAPDDPGSQLFRVRVGWARYGELRENDYGMQEVDLSG